MHRLLHLQHHSHTGKLLHHRHTSYRALALLLLATGLILIKVEMSLRQIATADSLYVTATVPAPIPTSPAVIEQPADNSTVTDPNLTVNGTCPVTQPVVSVAIYDNGHLLGSTPCKGGYFNLSLSLYEGNNSLLARTYTVTDDNGPDSTVVQVIYAPPVGTGTGSSTGSQSGGHAGRSGTVPTGTSPPASEPGKLTVQGDKPFIPFGPNQAAQWSGVISGGSGSYTVIIDWGDGTTNTYHSVDTNTQFFSHSYSTFSPRTVQVTAGDENGTTGSSNYSAVSPYMPPAVGNILTGTSQAGGSSTINAPALLGAYGAYVSVLAGFGAVWLHFHPGYSPAPVHIKLPRRPTPKRPAGKH